MSNTSPIYNLACIDRLPLLHEQFNEVWIPDAVAAELRQIPDVTVRQLQDRVQKLSRSIRARWRLPTGNWPLAATGNWQLVTASNS